MMKTYQKFGTALVAVFVLASCANRLSSSLRREIIDENGKVQDTERQVNKSEAALNSSLAGEPDLFRGALEAAAWKASVDAAKADLRTAEKDRRELAEVAERDRVDAKTPHLLAEERRLSEAALQKVKPVDRELAKWLDYERDPAGFASKITRERETLKAFDFAPVTKAVKRAEQDWPAKKSVLESRLTSLLEMSKVGEAPSQGSPSVLIAEDDGLVQRVNSLSRDSEQLQKDSAELYDAWDKILTDLDRSQSREEALYRERLKTVRTHFVDVPLKKTETHSDEHWTDVSEASYHKVENDIGMTIAHKDAGQFDSEEQDTPQPPGFSYVASPSVGSNQYGYWSHSGGESLWTFLPQYLILRELLWNHDYRPVAASEYNAYRVAQSRGTTYYGRESVTAAPKYGTHGTFTQQHYADSRYVQKGGFNGSAYASGGGNSSGSSWRDKFGAGPSASAAGQSQGGKRFGRQPGSTPLGERFGRAPSSRPAGRSFGRRR